MNEEYMSKQQILDLIEDTKETNDVISILKCRIKLFETDEDIVKVVRCKDCKNSSHWYGDRCRCNLWTDIGVAVFEDGYCSYGEKR